ncbi:MAG: hypothetical protein B7Y84_08070 [Azorhizobium sp. 32-67-21]|nr:MAG: hypothetical protein B7Y84_08070 [Azorhizobium sp. 32-67-21]
MTCALGDLLSGHARLMAGEGGTPVAAITADSRKVAPGSLFVAIPGTRADGTRFIAQAVAQGAAAILMEPVADLPAVPVPVAFSLNVRRSLALACARLSPRQPKVVAAVTGTAGKTSVAFFLRHIYGALGHRAAYLGTLGLVTPDTTRYGGLTSPGPEDLHPLLDSLAGEGITHMALEASSHGLDQHRIDGVRISAGGFTNLGRDHLDYHPTIEAYYRAKLRLFSEVRLERIGRDDDRLVFVDYAHKPEALEAVLETVRAAIPGRLVVVFGCGGDRDRGKRPLMGEIATARADVVIVTDDNPRSEPPAAIRAEILAAAPGAREIGDRAEAISTAIALLRRGDALVVAGKGHETGQIIGDRTFPFSDAAAIAAALES